MKNVTSTNTENVTDIMGNILKVGDYVALATPREMKMGKVRGFKPRNDRRWTHSSSGNEAVVVDCVGGSALSFVQYPGSILLVLNSNIRDAVEYVYNMGKCT